MGLYFWFRDLLSRPAVGWPGRLLLWPLTAAGAGYGGLLRLRRWAYRRGLLRAFDPGVPVISVGNVTAGGTGKTPCVETVCRLVAELGLRPAVLSRGYGGRRRGRWAVVADGEGLRLGPEEAGDEPVLLATVLPGVPVLVGADRRATARAAVERCGAQVLVLDDGFQHLRLRRALDLVTVDAANPFGNGHCLPRGLLREPPAALADAGLILLTRAAAAGPRKTEAARALVRAQNARAPIVATAHRPTRLVELHGGLPRALSDLRGLKLLAFAGIADPGGFFQEVARLGGRVIETVPFPDHHRFSPADVGKLSEWARLMNADALVTTEKDAVRLRPHLPLDRPVLVLGVRLEVLDPDEPLRAAVARAVGADRAPVSPGGSAPSRPRP